jgi:hypothetical protein
MTEESGWTNDDPNDLQDPSKWRDRPLPGMPLFPGPQEIRWEFQNAFGVEWTASYIDPCKWNAALQTLLPRHRFAADKIMERARGLIKTLGIKCFMPPHRTASAHPVPDPNS